MKKIALGFGLGAVVILSSIALTQLNLLTDSRGNITFARAPSDIVTARALGVSTAETDTVPVGAKYVIFSSTGDFYAKPNATATIPGDVTDGTAAELNPAMWLLVDPANAINVTNISVISPASTVVTFTYYKR